MANGNVYWIGADGNVWFKSSSGVRNMGKPINAYNGGFDTNQASAEATFIPDPNPPPAQAPPGGGGGGGSSAPQYADKSNDIALQLAGLSSVAQQEKSGISSIDKALGSLFGTYDTERTSNEGNFTTQSNTNQNNLQKNKQTALVNAAQGRQGLFGTLASIGALSGSGIDLANQAVTKGANVDLAGAADNYSGNQVNLDTAIGTFRSEDERRRKEAETNAGNAKTNVRNQAAKSRFQFYTNLSNDYAAQGDKAQAKKYSELAGDLYPELASTSIPSSDISYQGAAFTPGTLSSYLAGANDTTVQATPTQPGSDIPGLIATPGRKKKEQLV